MEPIIGYRSSSLKCSIKYSYADLKNTQRHLLSHRSKHKHNTDLITQKHCGIQASYDNDPWAAYQTNLAATSQR